MQKSESEEYLLVKEGLSDTSTSTRNCLILTVVTTTLEAFMGVSMLCTEMCMCVSIKNFNTIIKLNMQLKSGYIFTTYFIHKCTKSIFLKQNLWYVR